MRILLLSDIHSNLEALDACLASLPPFDLMVNLGDIVGYGASPNEVATRVRELGGSVIRGNHDRVIAGLDTVESFNPIAAASALWSRDRLRPDHLDWLRALPKGPIVLPECPDVQFAHGAPEDEDRYVVTIQDSLETLAVTTASITFFGHTHVQGVFCLRGDIAQNLYPEYVSIGNKEHWDFRIEDGASYMINPGSVGQPRDGDWRGAFAIFDSEQRVVTFYRVPYDLRSAQDRIFAANLPPRLATRLAAGR